VISAVSPVAMPIPVRVWDCRNGGYRSEQFARQA
jgi:hypothetical protein